jgi:prolycopene isomerase
VLLRVLPPDIENHLEYTQLSTPISIQRQTLHIEGAAYGMAPTSKRLMDMHLLPTSPLRNLYFTGADVFAHGII